MTEGHTKGMNAFDQLEIAILLPCYNEEATVGSVVRGFRASLPRAHIYVYDNNSSDRTAMEASRAGATVVSEPRQGKGNVVRRMFADIDADIYIMADGDGTYDPADAPELVDLLLDDGCDMVVGTRRGVTDDAGRKGHAVGNRLFNWLYKSIFGREFSDIFSGYRVFTRRFAKSFPALSNGFEIETEMSVHASALRLPVAELPLEYGRRPEDSPSKLSTFRDGAKILWTFAILMKETRPFLFCSAVSAVLLLTGVSFMVPVLQEYFQTGLVERLPTWITAVAMVLMAIQFFVAGVILDSVAHSRAEQKRTHYLSIAPTAGRDPISPGLGPRQRIVESSSERTPA